MKLKSYKNPQVKKWPQIQAVAAASQPQVPESRVPEYAQAIEKDGDPALRRIVKEINGRAPRSWDVDRRTVSKIQKSLDDETKSRLKSLKSALAEVHRDQMPDPVYVRTSDGIECHRQAVPIRRIGICIGPDAGYGAMSLMMLAVPARLAGCESIDVCVPADADGKFPAEVMHAAALCGIDHIYALSGEAAVAAMAVGTASIPRADKLFVLDPLAARGLPADISPRVQCLALGSSPSRVMIMADDSATAAEVAATLIDCASYVPADMMLVCASGRFAVKVERALDKVLQQSPLADAGLAALGNARIVIFEGEEFRLDALDFANMYAPDQLLLMVHEPAVLAEGVYAARTVQCGGSIAMSRRMSCGINMLADAGLPPDVAGTIGMDDFMHCVTFISG